MSYRKMLAVLKRLAHNPKYRARLRFLRRILLGV